MILVTGSEGFIGRNLIRKLREQGKMVFEFDTKHYLPGQLFEMVDFYEQIDMIYHLGAISSTQATDVEAINRYNTEFTINLLKEAAEYYIPVVYTSSASVFGNTMEYAQPIYNPLNYYAASKMMIEMWITNNYHIFKTPISVMRLFNVYGEDERKEDMSQSPIYKFTQQAKNTGVIKVFRGSSGMFRDFVCVEDVVHSLMLQIPGFHNVGTGKPITFLEVADMVADKYNATILFVDMPEQMKNSYQYYTKAFNPLPYNPVSVKDWLKTHS